MKRTSAVVISLAFGAAAVVGTTDVAGAAGGPNDKANCNGVYSYLDAQGGLRDDVSHILKELSDEFDANPGVFHLFGDEPCL